MSDIKKELIVCSGQHFHTESGKVVVLKRSGGTIYLLEPKTGIVHTLVTGYYASCQMKQDFIKGLAAIALGEEIIIARPTGKMAVGKWGAP